MNVRAKILCTVLAAGLFTGSSLAGQLLGNSSQLLYGRNVATATWYLGDDLPTFDPNNPTPFEPEGMTFYRNPTTGTGMLYVSGDSDETAPALVSYMPGMTGDLSLPTGIDMSANGSVWGPEGITVNTSGAGYGAFGPATSNPYLVSVESGNDPDVTYENYVGAINLNSSPAPVEGLHQPYVGFEPDDVAYVSSTDQFAVVLDPNLIGLFDHDASGLTLNQTAFSLQSPANVGDAKGLAVISEAFGEFLTGLDLTGETLLVAHESNDLGLYGLDGALIDTIQPFTSGLLPPNATESEIEAIAVDELNQIIYVGDEAGFSVTAIYVPEPTTLAGLALGALLALGRRR